MKILVKADNKTEEFEGKNFRTDTETDLMINAMFASMDSQEDPQAGIFWYDTVNDELFGVVKSPAAELPCELHTSLKARCFLFH